METNFLKEAEKFPNGEHAALTEEVLMWQEKYSRFVQLITRDATITYLPISPGIVRSALLVKFLFSGSLEAYFR